MWEPAATSLSRTCRRVPAFSLLSAALGSPSGDANAASLPGSANDALQNSHDPLSRPSVPAEAKSGYSILVALRHLSLGNKEVSTLSSDRVSRRGQCGPWDPVRRMARAAYPPEPRHAPDAQLTRFPNFLFAGRARSSVSRSELHPGAYIRSELCPWRDLGCQRTHALALPLLTNVLDFSRSRSRSPAAPSASVRP